MRDGIRFLLNGAIVEVRDVDPTTTLLRWLRETRRLTGSKEGCAEGDCGACTVLVGRHVDGRIRYQSVNACIAFLPTLDQASVLTIEHVAGPLGELHPCQLALVECHGSQCGFCTPGFVMSMYGLYLQRFSDVVQPTRHEIDDALGGNLCRCTGYGPLVAATKLMFAMPRPAWDVARQEAMLATFAAMQHREVIELAGGGRRMLIAATLDQFADLYAANPTARIVAGGTDVGLWVTKQARDLPLTLHLRGPDRSRFFDMGLDRLDGRDVTWIGGGVTHAQAMARARPALREIWRRFAGAQVRHVGTVGGNIANASPVGDLAPAFLAMNGIAYLRHGKVERRVALDDFFVSYGKTALLPGEFVEGIVISEPDDATEIAIHKVSKRFDDDISAVCGAFNIAVDAGVIVAARVAYGGMAAIPKRAKAVEAALLDKPWTRTTIDAALPAFTQDFQPLSDMRASAAYRMQLAQNLLVRTFIERQAPMTAGSLLGLDAALEA